MCGSLLVGCGGSDNKSADNNENITATIKVWGPAEDQAEENGKWLQTMCEQFNSEHPEWISPQCHQESCEYENL